MSLLVVYCYFSIASFMEHIVKTFPLTWPYLTWLAYGKEESHEVVPFYAWEYLVSTWLPIWLPSQCRPDPPHPSSSFGSISIFILTKLYITTLAFSTSFFWQPFIARQLIYLLRAIFHYQCLLKIFTRVSHCLKLDLLCLISSLRFYGSGGLFSTKNTATVLIGIEL